MRKRRVDRAWCSFKFRNQSSRGVSARCQGASNVGKDSMHTTNGAFDASLDGLASGRPYRSAMIGLLLAGTFLTGCSPPLYPLVGADPADASVPVSAVGYRSVVAPYVSLRPTTPKAWREQNDRAASPKSEQ